MSLRFFQLYSQIYSFNFIQNCFILSPLLQDLYLFILSVLLTTQISLFKYFYHNPLKGFITFCKFVPKLVSLLILYFLSTLTLANSWFFLRSIYPVPGIIINFLPHQPPQDFLKNFFLPKISSLFSRLNLFALLLKIS